MLTAGLGPVSLISLRIGQPGEAEMGVRLKAPHLPIAASVSTGRGMARAMESFWAARIQIPCEKWTTLSGVKFGNPTTQGKKKLFKLRGWMALGATKVYSLSTHHIGRISYQEE